MINEHDAEILALRTQAELNRLYMLREITEIEADKGEYEYGQLLYETLQSITVNLEQIKEELKEGF